MVGYGSREAVMDALEKAVSPGPFILGDAFSAADVYLGSQIGWGTQFGTIESRPAFVEYLGRIMSRPAAARAREIDDALVAKAKGG
jgi:glutathione S-transferase